MKRRAFGNTGIDVPVIGQGTWMMERDDRSAAIEALRRGVGAGMTHIDTAEMYGSGEVERIVGEAIADLPRDSLFIASKVLPHNASRAGTVEACKRSLERLGVDYLDLYLLHWPGSAPLADTIAGFESLVEAKLIRHYGVSNFDDSDLDRAVDIAGPGTIACNQVLYHLLERAIEHRVAPCCQRHDVALVAYSPFGSGEFPAPRSRGGAVLARVARRREATPYQIALAYLCHQSAFVIPKAARVDHALDNAAAAEIILSDEDVAALDAAFPRGPERSGIPVL